MLVVVLLAVLGLARALVTDPMIRPRKRIIPSQVTKFRGCFSRNSDSFPRSKELVPLALAESWEKVALIKFSIRDVCVGGEDFSIGIHNDSHRERSNCNFTMNTRGRYVVVWLRDLTDRVNQTTIREYLFRSTVVHEFGHVLGFDHEGRRFDAPQECQNFTANALGGNVGEDLTKHTFYDNNSTMNYCSERKYYEWGLSALDVSGVQDVYGIRSGSITKAAASMARSPILNPMMAISMYLAAMVMPFSAMPPACLPKWGACDYHLCYFNSSAIRVCPQCCEDRLCVMSPIGLTCQERPATFAFVCHAVRGRLRESFTTPFGQLRDTQYTLSDEAENCTLAIKDPQPSFDRACEVVQGTIMEMQNIYSINYILYEHSGNNSCVLAIRT